jgi:hypothetical protein
MKYPNQIMRLSELLKMGYSKQFLLEIYATKGQKIAWKNNPGKNSPIYFDTEELEKIREANCGI